MQYTVFITGYLIKILQQLVEFKIYSKICSGNNYEITWLWLQVATSFNKWSLILLRVLLRYIAAEENLG